MIDRQLVDRFRKGLPLTKPAPQVRTVRIIKQTSPEPDLEGKLAAMRARTLGRIIDKEQQRGGFPTHMRHAR